MVKILNSLKFLMLLLTTSMVLLANFGCVNNQDSGAKSTLPGNVYDPTAIIFTVDNSEITANRTTQVYAAGGTSPYIFSLESGDGVVDAITGIFTPDIAFRGTAVIKVTDSVGTTATLNVLVLEPLAVTPESSIAYINNSVSLTVTGGKPPYTYVQVVGGASMTYPTADTLILGAPNYEDRIKVNITDARFNTVSASVVVIAPLSVLAEKDIKSATKADGSANPMLFTIYGGMPDVTGEFTVTPNTGLGTIQRLSARKYQFTPDPYTEQLAPSDIAVDIADSNGGTAQVRFGFFIPLKLAVGGLHTCALNNKNYAGEVKCWGDGIHGQLGYGDDQYSQPYWGDCVGCNEDATIGDNFKQVEFLTAAEKAAGGIILDYAFGVDTLCAVVALDTAAVTVGPNRTVRCLGSNSKALTADYFRSRIAIDKNSIRAPYGYSDSKSRFPYQPWRHSLIHPDSGTYTGSYTGADTSYSYRVATADTYLLTPDWSGTLFPRSFNPLINTGSYQVQTPGHLGTFGLITTRPPPLAPLPTTFQDPSKFVFFDDTYKTSAWMPNQISMPKNPGCCVDTAINVINTSNQLKERATNGSWYATDYPYISSAIGNLPPNVTNINTGIGFKKVGFFYATYGEKCYIGTNDLLYCMGNNYSGGNGILGVDNALPALSNGLGWASLSVVFKDRFGVNPGGNASKASDVVMTNTWSTATRCGIFYADAVTNTKTVACWGTKTILLGHQDPLFDTNAGGMQIYARPVLIADGDSDVNNNAILSNVDSIYSNWGNICALAKTNPVGQQLYCWGIGTYNRMTSQNAATWSTARPISFAGGAVIDFDMSHFGGSCAITDNGTRSLKCWGTSTRDDYSIPKPHFGFYSTDITTYNVGSWNPIKVKLGNAGGCLLPADKKTLRCWGDNRSGVLGIGNGVRGNKPGDMANLANLQLGTGRKTKALSAGFEHSCAILDNDRLKCWGSNLYGELGIGNNVGFGHSSYPTQGGGHMGMNANQMGDNLPLIDLPGTTDSVKIVTSGGDHVCAASINNELYCWGDNARGQVGVGSTALTFNTPQRVYLRHDGSINILQVTLGVEHTCVLVDDTIDNQKNMYCWGSHLEGQLGYGDLDMVVGASKHTDSVLGNNPSDEQVQNLPPVYLGGYEIKQISAGGLNTCVLFANGTARCFGIHDNGQVGIGTYDNNSDFINDSMGKQFSEIGYKYLIDFGTNIVTGQPHKATSISVGQDYSCAVLDDGRLKCWGYNNFGFLGVQDKQNRGKDSGEMGDSLPYADLEPGETVIELSLGATHACAVLSNNKVKCWGANYSGQLGFDADYGRGAYPFTMGNSLPYCKVSF